MFRFLQRKAAGRIGPGASQVRFAISPDARCTPAHGDGIAFLHIRSGKVFTSNALGARIWQGLAEQASLESIAARVGRELGVEPRRVEEDAREFLAALEGARLVSRQRASQ
jgi:Coenzyme PQQ synthesis protein D (PqqD)